MAPVSRLALDSTTENGLPPVNVDWNEHTTDHSLPKVEEQPRVRAGLSRPQSISSSELDRALAAAESN